MLQQCMHLRRLPHTAVFAQLKKRIRDGAQMMQPIYVDGTLANVRVLPGLLNIPSKLHFNDNTAPL